MPPRKYSRHLYTYGISDPLDVPNDFQLTERVPFGFQNFTDNTVHVIALGDSLASIAGTYFASIPEGPNLWWVIADFQPVPIDDPTIALVAGATLIIPSVRTILEAIFSEDRRLETAL